jgi:hypothetical protein
MKKFFFLFCIFSLIFFSFQQSKAQKMTYNTRGGVSLGFGIGGVYQQSDIANSRGVGYDFTFGTPLYRQEGAFLAADWKFRFLAGENKAFDHRINSDGTFSNIDYRFFSYDLELGLILNRLRERTRIVVSGFAGAGITHGRTFTDIYNESNNLYDFSGIDPDREKRQVYDDLVNLSDGDFETRLVNKAAIMPTAGLYIGYQFSPSFSLGIEHKTNFSLSEENSTFGINMDNRVSNGSLFDMNHYTALGFVWKLGRRSGGGGRAEYMLMPDTPDLLATPTSPPSPPAPETPESPARTVSPQPPTVKITSPGTAPYTSYSGYVLIKADIRNVSGSNDISFYLENERLNDFSYNDYSNTFSARVVLDEGENHFRVLAANGNGSSEDRILVIFEKKELGSRPVVTQSEPMPPPPSGGPTVITQTYPVPQPQLQPQSQPQPQPQPQPSPRQPVVVPTPAPSPAPAPCLEPVIRLSSSEQISTSNSSYVFSAGLENISERSQVRLNLNGKDVQFNFTGNTISYKASLNQGANRFNLTVINDCGRDSRGVTVNADLTGAEPCESPVIDVNITPVNRSGVSHELKGTIRNIENKSAITLMVNGRNTQDFYFTASTGAISARFNFDPGTHTVTISSGNDCGYDTRNLNVDVAEPCRSPEIDIRLNEVNGQAASHELKGTVRNISSKANITLKINGRPSQDFYYSASTGEITAKLNFKAGSHFIEITAGNNCGYDGQTLNVDVEEPCKEPTVQISINPVNNSRATHELRGTVHNIVSKENINLKVNGASIRDFQFVPQSGSIIAQLNLNTGNNTVEVSVGNDCGYDNKSQSVVLEKPEEEKNCGTRINPGNSDWQFCLVTPRGTYNRSNLKNMNFSYSGSASSLFIMPTAGGGNAIVGGKVYPLKSGQYYLFTGNLRVKVITSHPGAMGQWWVCVESDRSPTSGNGNQRPKSPCER